MYTEVYCLSTMFLTNCSNWVHHNTHLPITQHTEWGEEKGGTWAGDKSFHDTGINRQKRRTAAISKPRPDKDV